MTGWIGDLLPTTGAAQIFATLAVSILVLRLMRWMLRFLGLGS